MKTIQIKIDLSDDTEVNVKLIAEIVEAITVELDEIDVVPININAVHDKEPS